MEADLESLIARAIELKRGDKEFALFFAQGKWEALIGNTCKAVYLGESDPEFDAEGKTPRESVIALISVIEASYASTKKELQ